MQPTSLTYIPLRLDAPDPGRCTECRLPAASGRRGSRRKQRPRGRRR